MDAGAIEQNLLRDAWVKSVTVNRVFPNTLQIVITERTVAAVVEVPTQSATSTQPWAIASDGMWLMAIPDQDSELGQSISQQIYEDRRLGAATSPTCPTARPRKPAPSAPTRT